MFDIIIKNGTIIDGTGRPMYKADVGIKEDKIAEIGDLQNEKGEIEIDALGKFVCPGFIDVNNHSDTYWRIFQDPDLESLVHQGITTIIGGNCGSSLAPLLGPETILSVQKWADIKQANLNWLTTEEFLEEIENKKLAVNFATLTGHATLRRAILNDQMRSLTEKEIALAGKALEKSLKDGALGMSAGLVYTHARSASFGELVSLAKIIKKFDGIFSIHIRNEGDGFKESIEEVIEVAEQSGVKLHISHLKIMVEKNWHLIDEALFLIGKAREKGADITFDVYPYTNTGSVLYTLLPHWVADGGKKMMLSRLRDSEMRGKIMDEMKNSGLDYAKMEISISMMNKTLSRRKMAEIAKSQNKDVEEAVLDLLLASEGRVIVSMDVLSPNNIEKSITHPDCMIATNGSGYDIFHSETGELVHPRNFGAFPKIFSKYVREKNILTWEAAVQKITSFPAQRFGIKKRGELKKKYFADIAIIDPEEIKDLATVDNPYQYSQGIDFVSVNGRLVIRDGKNTGIRAGEVVRRC